jgi:hypothetical protein
MDHKNLRTVSEFVPNCPYKGMWDINPTTDGNMYLHILIGFGIFWFNMQPVPVGVGHSKIDCGR